MDVDENNENYMLKVSNFNKHFYFHTSSPIKQFDYCRYQKRVFSFNALININGSH